MINLEFIKNSLYGEVKATVDYIDMGIEFPYELPLSFQIISNINGEVKWHSDMYQGCWSTYCEPNDCTAYIKDKNGIIINKLEYNPLQHGDYSHKLFMAWSLKNKGAKGIAIGTHDGLTGEWVSPVISGLVEAYLVEASDMQYSKLENNYKNSKNCKTLKYLVTADGKDYEFFEGGEGYTNSVFKTHILNYTQNINILNKSSISLNDLIIECGLEENLKWLHLDVEGLDSDLILSLDDNKIKMPEFIIYESLNLSDDKKVKTITFLENKGYSCKESGWNTVAYKKQNLE